MARELRNNCRLQESIVTIEFKNLWVNNLSILWLIHKIFPPCWWGLEYADSIPPLWRGVRPQKEVS